MGCFCLPISFDVLTVFYWMLGTTKIDIRNVDHLQENILFGFVGTNSIREVLNYCILYEKCYNYIKRVFNQNKLDLYAYLTLLKNTLQIEQHITIMNNKLDKFEKMSHVHDQL